MDHPYRTAPVLEPSVLTTLVLVDASGNEVCRQGYTARVKLEVLRHGVMSHVAYLDQYGHELLRQYECGVHRISGAWFNQGDTLEFIFDGFPRWWTE